MAARYSLALVPIVEHQPTKPVIGSVSDLPNQCSAHTFALKVSEVWSDAAIGARVRYKVVQLERRVAFVAMTTADGTEGHPWSTIR